MKRIVVEKQVSKIKAELEEIEEQEALTQLEPIERPDDTFMVVNLRSRKDRLRANLGKLQKFLEDHQLAEQPVF